MYDFSQIRSLEDIAKVREKLQQGADRQIVSLRQDATSIQREITHMLNRMRRVGHIFSSLASFFAPISLIHPKLSKGALLLSIWKRLLRRLRPLFRKIR